MSTLTETLNRDHKTVQDDVTLLADYGIVFIVEDDDRSKRPYLPYERIRLDVELTANDSGEKLQRRETPISPAAIVLRSLQYSATPSSSILEIISASRSACIRSLFGDKILRFANLSPVILADGRHAGV